MLFLDTMAKPTRKLTSRLDQGRQWFGRRFWWWGVVLLLALGLRLPQLAGSFWLDEAAQALESVRPLAQQFDIIPDFQPPLFHLLIHGATLVSHQEWWLRLVGALVPSLISLWLTMRIGRQWLGERAALVAGVILATNSLAIFYAQELRPYALAMMWGTVSWAILSQVTKTTWQPRWWLWWGVISWLGCFSTYLYPFLLLGQGCYVFLTFKNHWRQLLVTGLAVVVAYLPWLPRFWQQLAAGGEVRQSLPGWSAVVSTPQLKALPLLVAKFWYGVLDIELSAFFVLSAGALAGLMLVLIGRWWRGNRGYHLSALQRQLLWAACCWVVIPVVTAWVVSFWIPVIQPKRLLFLLPMWALGWAYLIDQQIKWRRWSLLLLLIGVQVWSVSQYYQQPRYQRENWRALYNQIAERYPAEQTVAVFVFPEPYAPWRWYDQAGFATLSTGSLALNQVNDIPQTLKPLTKYQYVVVFDYLRDLTDPERRLDQEIQAYGYQLVELIDFPNIGFTRIYARPGTTMSTNWPGNKVSSLGYARRN